MNKNKKSTLASTQTLSNVSLQDSAIETSEWERETRCKAVRARLKYANIPLRYEEAKIENCTSESLSWVHRTIEHERNNLIITGESGTGKTYTACAILNELVKLMRVRFTTTSEMLERIKTAYSTTETEEALIISYTMPYVLVLDDCGKERVTPWTLPVLFEIINQRYNKMRPTIFTTQYGSAALGKHLASGSDNEYAVAIIRRMCDGAKTIEVKHGR